MAPERSLLFVPADRPERFAKALAAGADRVIIDLEDAVAPDAKAASRDGLADWLAGPGAAGIAVRINAAGTPWHEDDLRMVAGAAEAVDLMLPKAEAGEAIGAVRAALPAGRRLIGLVETVRGFARLRELAAVPGLARVAFGTVDFCAETGIMGQGAELDAARFQIVLESSLAGLEAPLEGVTVDVRSAEALAADIDRARRLGFGGKLCIHPAQVAPVNAGFSPSPAEIDWATRVVAAARSGPGAVTVDGKLVDRPVVLQAEKILARIQA